MDIAVTRKAWKTNTKIVFSKLKDWCWIVVPLHWCYYCWYSCIPSFSQFPSPEEFQNSWISCFYHRHLISLCEVLLCKAGNRTRIAINIYTICCYLYPNRVTVTFFIPPVKEGICYCLLNSFSWIVTLIYILRDQRQNILNLLVNWSCFWMVTTIIIIVIISYMSNTISCVLTVYCNVSLCSLEKFMWFWIK